MGYAHVPDGHGEGSHGVPTSAADAQVDAESHVGIAFDALEAGHVGETGLCFARRECELPKGMLGALVLVVVVSPG